MCSCHGDPHCTQFDQPEGSTSAVDLRGSCIYTMASDGCGGSSATWEVLVDLDKVSDPTNTAAFISVVSVRDYSSGTVSMICG